MIDTQQVVADAFQGMAGAAPPMRALFRLIETVAPSRVSVLIQGESGTGKELVARALHARSGRPGRLVSVNCTALPEGLLEAELFGHTRGAFTGAVGRRRGVFAEASAGTLFLDEIGELQPAVQVKLLRALQEGEVRPVGQSLALHVDVRVVAATNADLAAAMAQGRFRADLYYRLAVVTLQVPPLRERIQDLPLLCAQLLPRVAARTGRPLAHVAPDALALLSAYAFPGNVRELENLLEHAALLGRGPVLTAADLPAALRARISPEPIGLDFRHARQAALLSFEQAYVGALLRRTAGNVSAAARQAGLDRANFRRLMRRLGMDRRQFS